MTMIDSLPEDLKKICQEKARVYLVSETREGVVTKIDKKEVVINIGTKRTPMDYKLSLPEFIDKLKLDKIVAKTRLSAGKNGYIVQKRTGELVESTTEDKKPTLESQVIPSAGKSTNSNEGGLQVAYLNSKKGWFSKEPKEGYSKILYKYDTTKITLDLTSEDVLRLKELGIIKE